MTKGDLKVWLEKSDLPDDTKICDIVTGHELQSVHIQKDCTIHHVRESKTTKETFINLNFN